MCERGKPANPTRTTLRARVPDPSRTFCHYGHGPGRGVHLRIHSSRSSSEQISKPEGRCLCMEVSSGVCSSTGCSGPSFRCARSYPPSYLCAFLETCAKSHAGGNQLFRKSCFRTSPCTWPPRIRSRALKLLSGSSRASAGHAPARRLPSANGLGCGRQASATGSANDDYFFVH
jgi:hypothetical protein